MIETQNNVAPILNEEKRKAFFKALIEVFLGYSFYAWDSTIKKVFNVLFLVPSIFLWLFTFQMTGDYPLIFGIATGATSVMIWTWLLLKHFLLDKQEKKQREVQLQAILIFKIILTPISCFLASIHFYTSRDNIWMSVISFVSLFGSLTTIYSEPVREFGAMTEANNDLNIRSTQLMRLYICNLVLVAEVIIFFVESTSISLLILRYVYCFIFGLWMTGLISDMKSMLLILFNWINNIVFGEQAKVHIYRTFFLLVVNAGITLGLVIEYTSWDYFVIVNSVLMGVSVLTSTLGNTICCFGNNVYYKKKHYFLEYILQIILLSGKIVLTVFIPTIDDTKLYIILGIDLALYILISLILSLGKSKTFLGTKQIWKIPSIIKVIFRWIVHSAADFSFIFLAHSLFRSQYLNQQYYTFIFRILLYRSYKRSIYQPMSFGLHLSFALSMALSTTIPMWIIPLSMITLPDNPFLLLVSPFVIPKKNIHQCEWLFRMFYIFLSLIGVGLVFASSGLLEPLMLFGLPIFMWSLPLTNEPVLNGQGKDKSIHQHLTQNLRQTISGYQVGIYLLRVSKYLVIARVIQKGIGYEIVQFRGLQAQQVTSCHGIEAQTVDNMVEMTWGQKSQCGLSHLSTVLTPIQKGQYSLFQSNEISLSGIIDSRQFATLLKNNYIKSLMYIMHKENYLKNYRSQISKTAAQISSLMTDHELQKYKFTSFFNDLGIQVKQNKKIVLEPLKKENQKIDTKPKKVQPPQSMFAQFQFMMEGENNNKTTILQDLNKQDSSTNLFNKKDIQQKVVEKNTKLFEEESLKFSRGRSSLLEDSNASIFQMAVTLCIYSLGRGDFIDQKKLFELIQSIKSCEKVLKNIKLQPKGHLCNKAIRFSFKLTIQQLINGDEESTLKDIEAIYQKNYYIGVLGQQQFEQAVVSKLQSIWSLDFKQGIKVNRYAQRGVEMYIFELDAMICKSIWNNLRFELLFVTNDDDERYSIQTHPHFLRNMLTQGAVQPFGYSPYYTGYQKLQSL